MEIIIKEYLNNKIEFKMIDGEVYANATSFGENQKLADWKRSNKTVELIEELSNMENFHSTKLIISERGQGKNSGTWIHENLVLDFAQYISIKFRVWCQNQITTLIREGEVKLTPALPQNYIEALEALIKSEKEKLEVIEENKIIKKDLEHKNEVIVDITENVPAKTMRKMINSIIRKNCKDYSARWNVLYTEFYNRYSVNLKIRAEHRLLNTLDYAEKFGYIRDLYNLTVELFETEYESIKNKFIGIR